MNDKDKSDDPRAELHELEEAQRQGHGRIEFDELGDAVWVPYGGLGSQETLKRLLDDNTLAITQDETRGSARRVQPNPVGLKKGYDPYDSGMLVKKKWKKKKDLRALSRWIEQKKKLGDEQ